MANWNRKAVFTAFALSLVIVVGFAERYSVTLFKYDCEANPKYYHNISCGVRKSGNGYYTVSNTVRNLKIDKIFYIFTVYQANGTKLKPLLGARNVTIDYCKYARGIGGSIIADVIFKRGQAEKSTQGCPYTDFEFGNLDLRRHLPTGTFHLDNTLLSEMYGQREMAYKAYAIAKVQQFSYRKG